MSAFVRGEQQRRRFSSKLEEHLSTTGERYTEGAELNSSGGIPGQQLFDPSAEDAASLGENRVEIYQRAASIRAASQELDRLFPNEIRTEPPP